jgi:hypothetical protein
MCAGTPVAANPKVKTKKESTTTQPLISGLDPPG